MKGCKRGRYEDRFRVARGVQIRCRKKTGSLVRLAACSKPVLHEAGDVTADQDVL
jgi:hypothetical protein